ncbi:hypothetical protein ACFQZX_14910 [Mucilaginibacter litoreus]|uniref:Uncharacterized protein n=1 Tax=Mucilaginibacter litoreus TaxID=1048221 RepID=A0ABW3AVL3_9SPHI
MKLLCIIFSICIIMLSARPCCADKQCNGEGVVKNDQSAGRSTEKDKCPGCSPFFSCGSCVGFIVNKQVIITNLLIEQHTEKLYLPYQEPSLPKVSLSIWQPPQLG